MSDQPTIAIEPFAEDGIVAAVEQGGGRVDAPAVAEGLIWTKPIDPQGLKETLDSSPARWVQLPFAGIEAFVAAGALDAKRTWTCTKGVYGRACAEHALALMLAAARQLHHHARARAWRAGGLGSPERSLAGLTVLIVGTGGIGASLVRMVEPLAIRVLAVNRSGDPLSGAERTTTTDRLPEVLPEADFVVLAAALTPQTRHLFDRGMLARMRPTAWLVNVARGGLVDSDALVETLRTNGIAGAALDVTEPEPLPDDHPLWSLDNALITPHVANTWDMALPELRALVARNVAKFGRGEPLEGLVDLGLGY